MFIHSSKKFKVRRADGSSYLIQKGFVGEIPSDVAKEWIIQEAIKEGSISTPASKKDKDIDKAAETEKANIVKAQKKKEKEA